jgi:gliding motility-associated-like protein
MRGFRKFLVVLFCIVSSVSVTAQSPADWWFFGQEAGVHFDGGNPIPNFDGQLTTIEGCAAISSTIGELMFYTGGTNVWDSTHTIMPNGTGLFGNPSSSQSAVIVPYPGNPSKFYVFTCSGCTGGCGTGANCYFAYSIVDMNLNGGLGDIDTNFKNIILFDSTAEKCTAVRHANGSDLWVLGHDKPGNTFYAYHLSSAGIVDTVVTSIGAEHATQCAGYMMGSPDGDKIAVAVTTNNPIEIFPFDQTSGVVGTPDSLIGNTAYGVHFSPSGQYLYVTFLGQGIKQYDVTAANIQASEYIVSASGFAGGMALGPDERLYVATSLTPYLDRINFPDIGGAGCQFQDSAVFTTVNGGYGLPNNIDLSLFNLGVFDATDLCLGNATQFDFDSTNINSVSWNFGDPGSGASNTSTDFFPIHVFSDTGLFDVRLIATADTNVDTAIQTVRIYPRQSVDLGNDTTICVGEQFVLDVSQPYAGFLWQDTSSSDTFLVNGAELIYVRVIGVCDTVSDTIRVTYDDSISFDLGPDTTLCGGTRYFLDADIQVDAELTWSTGDSLDTLGVTQSGQYFLLASNTCGVVSDTVEVVFKPIPATSLLPADTINCFDNEIVLSHPDLDSTTYVWSDSSSKKNYRVDTTETVWLAAFNECGATLDTINIIFNGEIVSELGDDTTICDLDTIVLDAFSPGADYLWSTGDTIDTILTAQQSQLYVVTVTQGLCQTIESKRVDLSNVLCPGIDCSLKVSNVFTPNGDGVNDLWHVTSDCNIQTFGLSIYNRWGQLVHYSPNAAFGWDGTVNGVPASEGVYYYELQFKDDVIVAVDAEEFKGSFTLFR